MAHYFAIALWLTVLLAAAPATDPTLWQQMLTIDAKADHIAAVRGRFRQDKFTPLMKKPLVSSGTIAARGSTSLWITEKPEPTRMRVTDQQIELYYPTQSSEEIYPIGGKLGSLASSPLPRLATLRKFFTFQQIAVHELDPTGDESHELALKLEPIEDSLRQHVSQVLVLLDRDSGLVKIAETTDPDGERNRMTFSDAQVNASLSDADLALTVPPGTAISHPLEGMGGSIDDAPTRGAATQPHGN